MGDADIRAARDRIETVEKRITALQEAGVDVAALRSQLSFAHGALREGRLTDVEAICDEVMGAAKRLAELGGTGTEAIRRVKVGRAQLADEVRAAIDAEVKAAIKPSPGPDQEIRLAALEQRLSGLDTAIQALSARPAGDPALAQRLTELDATIQTLAARPAGDPALAQRLTELDATIQALAARPAGDPSLAQRLSELDATIQTLAARPAGDPALEQRVAELGATVQALAARPITDPALDQRLDGISSAIAALAARPAVDPALEQRVAQLDDMVHSASTRRVKNAGPDPRLDALEQRMNTLAATPAAPVLDAQAIQDQVQKAVATAVPVQASELLREAIAHLPTRNDLQQIAETLRADLDWRLERTAAEHGWCSLADVQTTVRKAIAEQEPGGGNNAPVSMARLEAALTEFVQQTRDQQERLITALAQRVADHTASLTKRLLVREAPRPMTAATDTEELPSQEGHGSDLFAVANPAQPPSKHETEFNLDAVPREVVEKTKAEHGHTTMHTVAVPAVVPAKVDDLQELVTREVERRLGGEAMASTMSEASPALADDTLPTAESPPHTDLTPLPTTAAVPPMATVPPMAAVPQMLATPHPGGPDLAVQVAAEVGRQLAQTLPVQLPPSDTELARALVRVLPQVLADDNVRTELFAVLALEAAAKPGALGELTGIRRFLKRELQQAVEELAAEKQPA